MIKIKCTYENGKKIIKVVHGTFEEAKDYFVGSKFNLGILDNDFQLCTKIELLEEGPGILFS